ncbi:hypothetical protein NDU88_007404 [Pleurodeles waltl]|uniref:Uncharacterized protein n=1 Tax=Pleurodeles waltl TaxID=8319 RepID=A0AAV7QLQ8_PLEWA|nr:hypothetical protein NDU88_007404 [Pleurodeles waltl]
MRLLIVWGREQPLQRIFACPLLRDAPVDRQGKGQEPSPSAHSLPVLGAGAAPSKDFRAPAAAGHAC